MMNLDDTIKAFQCCIKKPPDCANCPEQGPGFGIECRNDVKAYVLLWLKAQKPRVLSFAEYRAITERPLEERAPVWLEWRGASGRWTIPNRAYEMYGVSWRCWTEKPTDEQRMETLWP